MISMAQTRICEPPLICSHSQTGLVLCALTSASKHNQSEPGMWNEDGNHIASLPSYIHENVKIVTSAAEIDTAVLVAGYDVIRMDLSLISDWLRKN